MTTSPITSEDLSWIDHPANLRANAALLRAIADQSLLHADEIERLRSMLDNVMSVGRLRAEFELFREAPSKLEVAQYEIERLRNEIKQLKEEKGSGCKA